LEPIDDRAGSNLVRNRHYALQNDGTGSDLASLAGIGLQTIGDWGQKLTAFDFQ
jgi:hypothetical protein